MCHANFQEAKVTVDTIRNFIATYPFLFFPVVFIISYFLYRLTRFILARGAYKIALRT